MGTVMGQVPGRERFGPGSGDLHGSMKRAAISETPNVRESRLLSGATVALWKCSPRPNCRRHAVRHLPLEELQVLST